MSLLERMRSGTDSTLMQVVFALVVISFVFWGIYPRGDTKQVAATVNGTELYQEDLSPAFRQALASYERYQGLADDDARGRIYEQARQELIRAEALAQEAESVGLSVHNRELAAHIETLVQNLDENDRYDKTIAEDRVEQMPISRAAYLEKERKNVMVRKLYWMVTLGVRVSDDEIRNNYVDGRTLVDTEFVVVDPVDVRKAIEIDAAELTAFIAENEERIAARYEADKKQKYDKPELVRLRSIRLSIVEEGAPVEELQKKLEKARSDVEGGADFAELALELSEDVLTLTQGGDMGEMRRSALSKSADEAIAGLEEGSLSKVVTTESEVLLYQLVERTPARLITLDEARQDIGRQELQSDRARDQVEALAVELQEKWRADGEAPDREWLAARGLTLDNTGPQNLMWTPGAAGPPKALVEAARKAEVNALLEPVRDGGRVFVGQVANRQDADMEEFANTLGKLREATLAALRAETWISYGDAVVARASVVAPPANIN